MPEGLKLTYMLPPNLSLVPDRDIKLGQLLPLSYDKPRVPDPESNLTDSPDYVYPDPSLIKHEVEEPWEYGEGYKKAVSGGVWADIPVLTAICGSLGFQRSGGEDITVEAKKVETSWFSPSAKYLATALQQPTASEHLLQDPKAPVFMVTGLKVAYDASITFGKEKSKEFHGSVGADLTAVGAPVKVGPEAAFSRSREVHFRTHKDGPFVLAYQLKRIRQKRDGSLEVKGYNSRAFLFDDELPTAETEFETLWVVDEVTSEMVLDEE
ncbi:unnamed protein product [Cercospora beticola]|nr:unnamed protein product [Cercospora beticola]